MTSDPRECPYEGCENTATAVYWAPDTEFPACDDCAPPYPPVRELEVTEQ